jgi:hypothetical protein
MSDKGQRAHTALSNRFSNIPAWEACSERTQGLLDKVGDTFDQLDTLETQFRTLEVRLDSEAQAVEDSLKEEIGGELVVRERPPMQMMDLNQLLGMLGGAAPIDADEEPEDEEPTIH